jgi:aspartyl protease family protein
MFTIKNVESLRALHVSRLVIQRIAIGFVLSLIVTACAPEAKQEAVETTPVASKPKKSASVVTLQKNPSDGQFWTQARVNTGTVRFLVDTGAGMVALTEKDAKKAGLKTRDLSYNVPIRTAGGENFAAVVTLDRISVGAITIKNVEAMIVPEGLDISLLGMTYLGELQSVQANRNTMTLRF